MVGAISTTSTSASTVLSAASSKSQEATLQAELDAKQQELSQAKTADEKTSINAEITKLKAAISAAKTSGQQDTTANQTPKTETGKADASAKPTSADKAAPESKVSSSAMDVMMQFGQRGGMMPPGGMNTAGGPPSIAQIYADMDSDSNGSVTKDEFVAGSEDRMGAERAAKIFAAIDSQNTGSITELQLADSMKHHGGPRGAEGQGHQPMGPWSGNMGQPFANPAATSEQASTTIV